MNFRQIEWRGMGLSNVAEDMEQWRDFAITILNLWVPLDVGKFLSNRTDDEFSRIQFSLVRWLD
jgi:hypothetical protein